LPILVLLLLLTSFVSNAEDDVFVLKGDLQVYLPRPGSIFFVSAKLIEHQSAQNTEIIFEQQCLLNDMAICALELPYHLENIDQTKQHTVDIVVNYQIDNKQQLYKTSFAIASLSNPQIMNIIIHVPRKPIS